MSKLNLAARYQAEVDAAHLRYNPLQIEVLTALEQVFTRFNRWHLPWLSANTYPACVYIYGSVGSGKTYLMDLFYHALPGRKKWRIHFHDLMEYISQALKAYQGQVNPMQALVAELEKTYEVICIDELMVEDVVHAMLFVELLPPLLARGLMLVFTSNTPPADLYLNGLQRERFLKVIRLLEKKAKILPLNALTDYRQLRFPLPQQVYWSPINQAHQNAFEQLYLTYVQHLAETSVYQATLEVQGRSIAYRARSDHIIWFDFDQIAAIPRCQRDYLELVKTYQVFFISGVPQFRVQDVSSLVLWMYLIDVLYDARAKLVILSDVALEKLYLEGPLVNGFNRTLSRMREMQSQWYWDQI